MRRLASFLFLLGVLLLCIPLAVLLAQDTVAADTVAGVALPPQAGFFGALVALALPLITAKLTELGVNALKRASAKFANAKPWMKQAAGLLTAVVLSFVAGIAPVTSTGIDNLAAGDIGIAVNALVSWMLAMLLYNGKKLATVT